MLLGFGLVAQDVKMRILMVFCPSGAETKLTCDLGTGQESCQGHRKPPDPAVGEIPERCPGGAGGWLQGVGMEGSARVPCLTVPRSGRKRQWGQCWGGLESLVRCFVPERWGGSWGVPGLSTDADVLHVRGAVEGAEHLWALTGFADSTERAESLGGVEPEAPQLSPGEPEGETRRAAGRGWREAAGKKEAQGASAGQQGLQAAPRCPWVVLYLHVLTRPQQSRSCRAAAVLVSRGPASLSPRQGLGSAASEDSGRVCLALASLARLQRNGAEEGCRMVRTSEVVSPAPG